MKFHLADTAGMNLFTGYDRDYVAVNHRQFRTSLIVLPERIIEEWPPRDFAALEAGHFEVLLEIAPEIVLLGTGDRLCFPHPRLTQALTGAGIGFEALAESDFEAIRTLGPEILLLGTGDRQRFPAPSLLRPLIEARIGYEIMDLPAACRTFNILASEGRKVAAALLISAR